MRRHMTASVCSTHYSSGRRSGTRTGRMTLRRLWTRSGSTAGPASPPESERPNGSNPSLDTQSGTSQKGGTRAKRRRQGGLLPSQIGHCYALVGSRPTAAHKRVRVCSMGLTMEAIDDLLARILLETAIVYKRTCEQYKRKCLLDIMDKSCRQYCNMIDVKQISRLARERMKEMKLDPARLHALKWANQKHIDPERKVFINEHCYSIQTFCRDAINLQPLDIQNVKKHLKLLKDVWILRTEDNKLPKSRGANWPACYKVAGIELVWPEDP